jgi:peptide/nickel transport system permease protein
MKASSPKDQKEVAELALAEEYKTRSEWSMALRVLLNNRAAVAAICILLLIVVAAIFARQVAPYDPYEHVLKDRLLPPSRQHILGTDPMGRDIFSRIVFGARISLTVGVLAVGLGTLVGVPLGLAAGYYGGRFDVLSMRAIEVVMAFPGILLAIFIVAVLGPGVYNVVLALSTFALPHLARIARATTLSLKEQDFVMAARSTGLSDARIMFRHILPNMLSPLIVVATLRVARVIISASSLSFLGMGAQPPTPEWGAMINQGRDYMRVAPHIMIYPGLAIFVTVLTLNFVGDAIRDALDPRMWGRGKS